jgi:putative endonuclease
MEPFRQAIYNRGVHFVYIVRCADGTLYTGYARDPEAREKAHNTGRGARYTAGRRPVTLVYAESFEVIGDALRRERQVKRLSRKRKEALVAQRFPSEGCYATRTFSPRGPFGP